MPWSNQNGGGGPWGGGGNNNGGGGPWGQKPQGGGGKTPPDLEDIFRRGQDRLRQAIPGGNGSNPAIWGLIALALIAFWLFQCIYTVQPDERAVELRFGKPKADIAEPGLHFHFWPIESYEKIEIV